MFTDIKFQYCILENYIMLLTNVTSTNLIKILERLTVLESDEIGFKSQFCHF